MRTKEWKITGRNGRPNRAFIWNENYGQGCYVIWGATSDQLKIEFIHVDRGCKFGDKEFFLSSGKFLAHNNLHCVAFKSPVPQPGVIAHECLHFSNYLFDHLGIKTGVYEDEAQAYFLQWCIDKIYRLTRGRK
jgi:hypothetical protein